MFKSKTSLTTIIGESTKVDGTVETKSAVRIDGTINGDITAVTGVIISEVGEVNGNIESPNGRITIDGIMNGDINAEAVSIGAKAKVAGAIKVKRLQVEDGAIVNSTIQMDLDPDSSNLSKADDEQKSS
jgi:cytoskeletal protein CcmA (bactofilin family)